MSHILKGEIRAAISMVNDIDPGLMRKDLELAFALQKQALLEMMKTSINPMEVLKFAQIQLAPLIKAEVCNI